MKEKAPGKGLFMGASRFLAQVRWRHNGWEGVPKAPNWLFFAMHKIF
jgi:hypothetical protein